MSEIAKDLEDLLNSRDFDVETLDSRTGKPPVDEKTGEPDPEAANVFQFDYVGLSGKNYGVCTILLGAENTLELYSSDYIGRTMTQEDKDEWFEFLQQLKNFAIRNFRTFKNDGVNRMKYSLRGQAYVKESLLESYYGNRSVSYNGRPTDARLMIKHNRVIGENDRRYMYIESLFIETVDQERFKLPFRRLSAGKAMLEHVRQGGRPYDLRGQHICEIAEELNVLSRFNRANKGRIFEGETLSLVTEATTYYESLQQNLKGLATTRGYNKYFESWDPTNISDGNMLTDDIKQMFVEQSIDTRIEQALPILAKIKKGNIMRQADIFEGWANKIMDGIHSLPDTPEKQEELVNILSNELSVGADATNATEALMDVFLTKDLIDELKNLADQDPDADARELIISHLQQNVNDPTVKEIVAALNATQDSSSQSTEDDLDEGSIRGGVWTADPPDKGQKSVPPPSPDEGAPQITTPPKPTLKKQPMKKSELGMDSNEVVEGLIGQLFGKLGKLGKSGKEIPKTTGPTVSKGGIELPPGVRVEPEKIAAPSAKPTTPKPGEPTPAEPKPGEPTPADTAPDAAKPGLGKRMAQGSWNAAKAVTKALAKGTAYGVPIGLATNAPVIWDELTPEQQASVLRGARSTLQAAHNIAPTLGTLAEPFHTRDVPLRGTIDRAVNIWSPKPEKADVPATQGAQDSQGTGPKSEPKFEPKAEPKSEPKSKSEPEPMIEGEIKGLTINFMHDLENSEWGGKSLYKNDKYAMQAINDILYADLYAKLSQDIKEQLRSYAMQQLGHWDASLDENKCNMTAEGKNCPVHGLEECYGGSVYESKEDLGRLMELAGFNEQVPSTTVTRLPGSNSNNPTSAQAKTTADNFRITATSRQTKTADEVEQQWMKDRAAGKPIKPQMGEPGYKDQPLDQIDEFAKLAGLKKNDVDEAIAPSATNNNSITVKSTDGDEVQAASGGALTAPGATTSASTAPAPTAPVIAAPVTTAQASNTDTKTPQTPPAAAASGPDYGAATGQGAANANITSKIPQAAKSTQSFSKSVTDIAKASGIADPNKIQIGQKIKLPGGEEYTVAKGDTLSGIAAGKRLGTQATQSGTTKSAQPPAQPPAQPEPSNKTVSPHQIWTSAQQKLNDLEKEKPSFLPTPVGLQARINAARKEEQGAKAAYFADLSTQEKNKPSPIDAARTQQIDALKRDLEKAAPDQKQAIQRTIDLVGSQMEKNVPVTVSVNKESRDLSRLRKLAGLNKN